MKWTIIFITSLASLSAYAWFGDPEDLDVEKLELNAHECANPSKDLMSETPEGEFPLFGISSKGNICRFVSQSTGYVLYSILPDDQKAHSLRYENETLRFSHDYPDDGSIIRNWVIVTGKDNKPILKINTGLGD